MKKIKILAIFLFIFTISGCLQQKQNILSFEESLLALNKQNNILLDKYSIFFDSTGIVNQSINFDISSSDKNSITKISTKTDFSLDWNKKSYNSQTNYDLSMFDNQKNQKIISSGNFFYSNIEYVPYFKLNKFDLDMGTGNIESNFLNILMNSIIDKWIMVDIQNEINIIQQYLNINYFSKDLIYLSKCQIFDKVRNTIYKGNRSYKIGINSEIIKDCINKQFLDYTGIVFDGFITPLGNNIILEIKKLQLPNNKDIFINGEIDKNKITINIHNKKNNTTMTIDFKYSPKHDNMVLKSANLDYNIDIYKSKNGLEFNGNINTVVNDINKTKSRFDIKGNLDLQNTGYLDIKAPQNYIIMSQLLGDKFSLKNIVEQ